MIRRLTKFILLAALPALPWCGTPNSARADAGGPDREYKLKAAYIFNFAQFVDWPATAFPGGANGPFVIGVVGDPGFAATLEQVVKGKTAGKRSIEVQSFQTAANVAHCQILFIGNAERQNMAGLVRRATTENILTIGDFDGFLSESGMVRFVTEDNRLRFEVNKDAADAAQVKLGAQLLKLARNK
jgi:hypothetical protein